MRFLHTFGNLMQSTMAVAETVWKRVMDRTLGLVLLGGAAVLLALVLTSDLQTSDVRATLLLIQLFVTLLVIFIGTTEIPRDLATRNIQVFLAKPLSRGEYIFGKFTGLFVLAEMILVAYLACLAVGLGVEGLFQPGELAQGFVRITLQLITLCALLVWLSVMLPEVAATVFGVTACIVSYLVFILPGLASLLAPEWAHPFLLIFYYALPNGQHYLWNPELGRSAQFLCLLALYSVFYSLCALTAASLWFRKRDLM